MMKKVAYHILVGLTARMHRKNKAPWPALSFWIRLYEIQASKHVDVEAEEKNKYPFDAQSYNPYDLNCLMKDHFMKVQFTWIHGECHWVEEDPQVYFYSFSRPNELVGIVVEWLKKQHEAASRRAPTPAPAEVNILVCDKGKRKIVDNMEEEQI